MQQSSAPKTTLTAVELPTLELLAVALPLPSEEAAAQLAALRAIPPTRQGKRRLHLLRTIAGRWYKSGKCFARQATMARVLRAAKSTIQLDLDALELDGFLRIERREGTSNITRLAPGVLDALHRDHLERQAAARARRRARAARALESNGTETAPKPARAVRGSDNEGMQNGQGALSEAQESLVQRLIAEGVTPQRAQAFVARYDAARIERNLKLGLHREKRTPGAYLCHLIEHDIAANRDRPQPKDRAGNSGGLGLPHRPVPRAPVQAPAPTSPPEDPIKGRFEALAEEERSWYERRALEDLQKQLSRVTTLDPTSPMVQAMMRGKALSLFLEKQSAETPPILTGSEQASEVADAPERPTSPTSVSAASILSGQLSEDEACDPVFPTQTEPKSEGCFAQNRPKTASQSQSHTSLSAYLYKLSSSRARACAREGDALFEKQDETNASPASAGCALPNATEPTLEPSEALSAPQSLLEGPKNTNLVALPDQHTAPPDQLDDDPPRRPRKTTPSRLAAAPLVLPAAPAQTALISPNLTLQRQRPARLRSLPAGPIERNPRATQGRSRSWERRAYLGTRRIIQECLCDLLCRFVLGNVRTHEPSSSWSNPDALEAAFLPHAKQLPFRTIQHDSLQISQTPVVAILRVPILLFEVTQQLQSLRIQGLKIILPERMDNAYYAFPHQRMKRFGLRCRSE